MRREKRISRFSQENVTTINHLGKQEEEISFSRKLNDSHATWSLWRRQPVDDDTQRFHIITDRFSVQQLNQARPHGAILNDFFSLFA
jgi:hypothetical protein